MSHGVFTEVAVPLDRTFGVLFDDGVVAELARDEPPYFPDLHLDQLVEHLVRDWNADELRPLFWTRLSDEASVEYRQGVFRDLEDSEVLGGVRSFVATFSSYVARFASAGRVDHPRFRDGWELEALSLYIDAVAQLDETLSKPEVRSRALSRLGSYVNRYRSSVEYNSFVRECSEIKDAMRSVEYIVNVRGTTVTVAPQQELQDYSKAVLATFDRFREADAHDYRVRLADLEMNHVLGRVLDNVARLNPIPFERSHRFLASYRNVVSPVIAQAHRELPFYLSYLDYISPLRSAGVPFCEPDVRLEAPHEQASDAVDLVLANSIVPNGTRPVPNDFELTQPERILVVTGPNQGGKTTLARAFGQLHHLGSIGVPVSARSATLALPDQISTHFERREEVGTLRGKLKDELVSIRDVLLTATPRSVVIMNETFSSTSLEDARELGHRILDRLSRLGVLGLYVTFVDELAGFGPSTVSMVAEVDPQDPVKRTFKVRRAPADGLVYALQLASAYGLNYRSLVAQLRGR
jgi:DNA mismatch repair protein MutS